MARRRRSLAALALCLLLTALGGVAYAAFTATTSNSGNSFATVSKFPRCLADEVLSDNPTSYWKLDETSGTSAADSKGTNNGHYAGGTALAQAGALADTANNAAGFDGADDYVSMTRQIGDDFTIEFWFKSTQGLGSGAHWWGNAGLVDAEVAGNTNDFGTSLRADGRITAGTGGASDTTVTSTRSYNDGAWHHVAFTRVKATGALRLYVDGLPEGSATGGTTSLTAPPAINLGRIATGMYYFAGSLDEVAVHPTALSEARARAHYNAGRCYRDEPLADTPAAYWRLGEPAGAETGFDSKGGSHGAYLFSPTLGQAGALDGDPDTAAGFDGANDKLVVPDANALDLGDSVTVEAWIKRSGTGTTDTIEEKLGSYKLSIPTSNRVRFRASTVGDIVDSTVTITDTTSWHHIVATKNGASAKIYIDGVDRTGTVANVTLADSTSPLYIGVNSTTEYFHGAIDDLAVYDNALTAARVQSHYIAGRAYRDVVLHRSPVSFWRFGEGSGTAAADEKGANAGTYTGSPSLGQSGAIAGDGDRSVRLNGTSQYVSVGDSASLGTADTFTLETWVKRGSNNTADVLFDKGTGSYELRFTATGALTLAKAGTGDIVASTTNLTDTLNFHHVVATKSGATVKLYIDGVDRTGTVTNQTIANSTSPLVIGSNQGGANFLDGTLDEAAVYNTALSAGQVKLHYDAGRDAPR